MDEICERPGVVGIVSKEEVALNGVNITAILVIVRAMEAESLNHS